MENSDWTKFSVFIFFSLITCIPRLNSKDDIFSNFSNFHDGDLSFYCNIFHSSIFINYSQNTRWSFHLPLHLGDPSRILIALIGLFSLEENMNPLIFWFHPKLTPSLDYTHFRFSSVKNLKIIKNKLKLCSFFPKIDFGFR